MSEKGNLLKHITDGKLDFFRSYAIESPLPGAYFHKNSVKENVYYSTGINYAPYNGIMEEGEYPIASEDEIDKAINFFSSRHLPFIWWTSSKSLERKGFVYGGVETGIALDISEGIPPGKPLSDGVEIKEVESDQELKIFCDMLIDDFGMDNSISEQFTAVNKAVMKHGEQMHLLAYLNGTPVGTATLTTNYFSAGIWNLSTLPNYRKHGLGTALVQSALTKALEHKYDHVMALLMPNKMSEGLFSKFGFKTIVTFPFYVYGAPL